MKKVLSLFLCLIMLVDVFPASAISVAETESGVSAVARPHNYETYGSIQTLERVVDLEKFEKFLLEAFCKCETEVDISSFRIPYNSANWDALGELIFDEMEEAFHIASYRGWYEDGLLTNLEIEYEVSASEYQTMLAQVESAVETLVQGIQGNSALSDAEKALLLHDRLALICEYDYNDTPYRYDHYGALVMGSAVCQGYTEAYHCLLERVGIENYTCVSKDLNHIWNIVYIDGVPYHVDVTWDDIAWDSGTRGAVGAVEHSNFLRSSKGISATGHIAMDYDTYPVDTKYDNWFWQNSRAAFVLVGGEIYYIDNEAEVLKRYSDDSVLCSVSASWDAEYGVWDNQARLATDGRNLYYSLNKAVYKYDLTTQTSTKAFEPELSRYNHIYGMEYSDGYFICDISDAPPYATSYREELYQIKEKNKTISSLAVKSPPAKTRYIKGELLDLTGLELVATYSDGRTVSVAQGLTAPDYQPDVLGSQTLQVEYDGLVVQIVVEVVKPVISGITVSAPNTTQYTIGEKLNLQGMSVTANMPDGTARTISTCYTVSGYDPNVAGEQTITVSYEGYTATFMVTVSYPNGTCGENVTWELVDGTLTFSGTGPMKDLTAATQPWKSYRSRITKVVVEEGITSIGASLLYYCTKLTDVCIPASVTTVGNMAFYKASAVANVYYSGSAEQWDQIAIGTDNECLTNATRHTVEAELTGITVTVPTKTAYWTGEKLDTTGMVITAAYSNGTTKTVTNGYTVTGFDTNTLGEQTITITYEGYATTFTVTVSYPNGTCGENVTWELVDGTLTFSGTGPMKDLTAATQPWKSYRSRITKVVVEEGITSIGASLLYYCTKLTEVCIPASVTTVGNMAFYKASAVANVYYDGTKTQWNQIAVGTSNEYLTGATLHTNEIVTGLFLVAPRKTVYAQGEPLDTTDMTVIAIYSDDANVTVTEYVLSGYDPNLIGEQTVIVSYGGLATSFNVTVVAPTSGACGENLTWKLVDGILTISGTGAMENYNYENGAPWHASREEITSVVIAQDVTTVGDCAFQGCSNLQNIDLPESVTIIGHSAFVGSGLQSVTIPESVIRIGEAAFSCCIDLKDVYYCGTAEQWEQVVVEHCNDYLLAATLHTAKAILYGDVDGNGVVNNRDRAILTRYLADWEGYEIDIRAADVNRDGEVNTLDRVILTRYLADWDEYSQLPYTG